ncbi:dipeptide epimerase [Caloramator proteoclasticus]|uniref:Dipeptide epimerase n=1 Tax=Caloramator proteoclasticus DSM 10124 TaxID=1121262 RepID=A0A1M4VKI2_9CLOT|nr:dipeptide epimerase [Caloramator proteoclasticus]SHE69494.1 o-succinylbenzoate synthase [Caloramator proteoclasticus DSM 10124]
MKIIGVDIKTLEVPLEKPFKTALREVTTLKTYIIELYTDDGNIGYGEAASTPVITGDLEGNIKDAVFNYIFPSIKGMDVEEIENIMYRINKCLIKNTSAKAAVDMAVYDLFAKMCKKPLYVILGGARTEVETDITVSVKEPKDMAEDAEEYVSRGFNTLKIKVGIDSELDIKRVKAIRDVVPKDINIRLDANQGWSAKEAVRTIRKMEDMGLDIELIEQPVPYYDIEGLKYVTDNTYIPIMADESLFSLQDAVRLLSNRACDILNIKLMKCGGLYNAQKILSIAEAYGVECMIGSMMESSVGITFAASLACGRLGINKVDLDAALLLKENRVDEGIEYHKNIIKMSKGVGSGIKGIRY